MTRWNETNSRAVFSPCRQYRYELWRHLENGKSGTIAFIGLNPSTADETTDDRTVAKCWRWADKWGYGHFCMLNLFAWRDTDPKGMFLALSPVSQKNFPLLNDLAISQVCEVASAVVACWGVHGAHLGRDAAVLEFVIRPRFSHKLFHLGLTKHGHPRHPLYLKNDTKPQRWRQP